MFDAYFIEKYGNAGLTHTDIEHILTNLPAHTPMGIVPITIEANEVESVAFGFMTAEMYEALDFDVDSYETEQIGSFAHYVRSILNDMDNETEDGVYTYPIKDKTMTFGLVRI